MKRMIPYLCVAVLIGSMVSAGETRPDNPVLAERNETPAQHDARMVWFRDAHFGMFIHWGLYAQAGGVWKGRPINVNGCAEWLMYGARAPIAEYAAMAKDFNPVNYDAEKWVKAAKAAGVQYIVITAKHHEGFAMFKTAASPYNIVDATPYKHDPLKDLAAACRKHGMRLGFYYSQNLDWHHPGGGSGEWDPAHRGDPEKYVNEIAIPQIREILTHYGEIEVLWFDIPGGVINKQRADRIQKVVLACNPKIIINNRLGGGYHGDTQTPEQFIPANGFPGKDWEVCMTMNNTWGFSKVDHHWKPARQLLHNLCDITSKGGNYLLNVGPTELGEIPGPSLERLHEIGAWLKKNGEAIYGTRASVFAQVPAWGRVTTKRLADGNTRLYAIVFDAPKDGVLHLDGLTNDVVEATILGGGPSVRAATDGERVTLTIPEEKRGDKDFVVALVLKGAAVVDTAVHPNAAGIFTLLPRQAALHGSMQVQGAGSAGLQASGEENLGFWTDHKSTAAWTVKSPKAQAFQVKARLAAIATSAGSVVEFVVGDQVLPVTVKSTGAWDRFADVAVGTLQLPTGTSTLTLRAKTVHGLAPCNVGAVVLAPVEAAK
jgi:alpha-L-fucosidase